MRARNATAIATLALSGCSYQSELSKELGRESVTHGLALVSAIGNRVHVIPFDENELYFQAPYQEPLIVVYGKARVSDGRTITATGFSAFSPAYRDYHWIMNYRKFLEQARDEGTNRE